MLALLTLVLGLIFGFLLGIISEAKVKNKVQEETWKEINDLAKSMNKIGMAMIKLQTVMSKRLEEKKDENNR